MMFNIWDQLLAGFIDVITTVAFGLLPPGSDYSDIANAIDFVGGITSGFVIVIQFTVATLEAFNWIIPIAAISWMLLMFLISFAISILEFIKSILDIATSLIAMIAKFLV